MLIVGVGLLLSSCNDWLQVGSETELTEEEMFSTDEGFHKALSGIYIGMTDSKLYGSQLTWRMLDHLAHYYASISGSSDGYVQVHDYNTTNASAYIKNAWNGLYNLIANCNNLLEKLEEHKDEVNPLGYQLMKGEALALRAFFHFDLMRMFGHGNLRNRTDINLNSKLAIPYVTTFSKDITPQRTYAETFELMKADLYEAIDLLWGENGENCIQYMKNVEGFDETAFEEANGSTRYFFTMQSYNSKTRVDYYIAKAILARVLMWEGTDEGYKEAYDIAEEWIAAENDDLPDAWDWVSKSQATNATLKNRNRVYTNENVWHLYVDGLYDLVGSWFTIPTMSGVYDYLMVSESVAKNIYEYDTNNSLALSDYRFSYLLTYNSSKKGYAVLKVDQAGGELNTSYNNRIQLIGTPEMFYIAAEVCAEGLIAGKTLKDAVGYLNTVRNKRGVVSTFNLSEDLSYSEVKEEILKEARKEFLCWGQMFFFYKRLGVKTILNYESAEMSDVEYVLPYPDDEVINGGRIQ